MPRQGIPPRLDSWEDYARRLNWGRVSGRMHSPAEWWWELRLHLGVGTLEIRCPDAQIRVADASAVAAFALGLAAWLAARYDVGDLPPAHSTWQINENRWSATRYGLLGELVDLETGIAAPARERVLRLIDDIAPTVDRLGGAGPLCDARVLAGCTGAERQRNTFKEVGMHGLVKQLAEDFLRT